MTECTVLVIGEADRWRTSWGLQEREDGYAQHARSNETLAAGGHIIVGGGELSRTSQASAIPAGDGIEVRPDVDPADRPS